MKMATDHRVLRGQNLEQVSRIVFHELKRCNLRCLSQADACLRDFEQSGRWRIKGVIEKVGGLAGEGRAPPILPRR